MRTAFRSNVEISLCTCMSRLFGGPWGRLCTCMPAEGNRPPPRTTRSLRCDKVEPTDEHLSWRPARLSVTIFPRSIIKEGGDLDSYFCEHHEDARRLPTC